MGTNSAKQKRSHFLLLGLELGQLCKKNISVSRVLSRILYFRLNFRELHWVRDDRK